MLPGTVAHHGGHRLYLEICAAAHTCAWLEAENRFRAGIHVPQAVPCLPVMRRRKQDIAGEIAARDALRKARSIWSKTARTSGKWMARIGQHVLVLRTFAGEQERQLALARPACHETSRCLRCRLICFVRFLIGELGDGALSAWRCRSSREVATMARRSAAKFPECVQRPRPDLSG